VLERGRHEQLLDQSGAYAKLYRTHLAGSGEAS
jgi:ABC-type transport system involved in Fe-S cluster assembly fused permease/ATPase subunit